MEVAREAGCSGDRFGVVFNGTPRAGHQHEKFASAPIQVSERAVASAQIQVSERAVEWVCPSNAVLPGVEDAGGCNDASRADPDAP